MGVLRPGESASRAQGGARQRFEPGTTTLGPKRRESPDAAAAEAGAVVGVAFGVAAGARVGAGVADGAGAGAEAAGDADAGAGDAGGLTVAGGVEPGAPGVVDATIASSG